jgi:cytochrome P450
MPDYSLTNEGLRVAHGASSHPPRIATHEDLVYKQWTVPRGTPVIQSLYLLHTDRAVFPDPLAFRPERWIENPDLKRHILTKHDCFLVMADLSRERIKIKILFYVKD